MSEMKTQRLSDSVALHTFSDSRFKTMKVSVNMLVPLQKATAARNAICQLLSAVPPGSIPTTPP